ncbi:exodeoxyribonuclease III [Candidatus Marinimicrobia bacterium]|nr:exodeoxyribonuclease III [Candidatus Neomarinimicrobiota bacterium]
MKIISWNVNGIRAVLKKGFLDFISEENPDIICLQETKAHKDQVDLVLDHYPHKFWNSALKKGYSGTAVFSKVSPNRVHYGIGIPEHDQEGRVITLEFDSYYLTTVYTPNSKRELLRLDYRKKWDIDFFNFLKNLEQNKPVILCGDLNVAHKEIDLKNPKTNKRNPGFTEEERSGFDRIINGGFIDTFREFNKEPGHYTWWSYMFQARKKNIGWRIDYFCISKNLRKKLIDSIILKNVLGSDHAPVAIEIND